MARPPSVAPSSTVPIHLPACRRCVMLVKPLAQERLDYRLSANVQLLSLTVQLFQHRRGEVHIYALYWRHYSSAVCEKG